MVIYFSTKNIHGHAVSRYYHLPHFTVEEIKAGKFKLLVQSYIDDVIKKYSDLSSPCST